MMTHSSKKPYECKYFGCDKSYCDARSLRRHLENQHQQVTVDCGSSSASDRVLTPRSATDLPSMTRPTVFSFDFVNSPGVGGQNVTTDHDHDLTTGLSHSQSSPTISASTNATSSGMVWMGGFSPLE